MTIEQAKSIFFNDLDNRVKSSKGAKSLVEHMDILSPQKLVSSIEAGANKLRSELTIQSYHESDKAIRHTLKEASELSEVMMPYWHELREMTRKAMSKGNLIGTILDWGLGIFGIGNVIGKVIGLRSLDNEREYLLVDYMERNTDKLIKDAKNNFDVYVHPYLLKDFSK